jgi:hypothetical protein
VENLYEVAKKGDLYMKEYGKAILEDIGEPAVLEQLAEECCELGQAALKLARIYRYENPTPVSIDDARKHVMEEFMDIDVCLGVLMQGTEWIDLIMMTDLAEKKLDRWIDRLELREEEE